jgi:hypothetical protein
MDTLIDPVEVESVETAVLEDTAPTTIITTLYDLIDAIQTAAGPHDDAIVVATVLHLLHSGRVTWHGGSAPQGVALYAG